MKTDNNDLEDIRIDHISPLIPPSKIQSKYSLSEREKNNILKYRKEIKDIILGKSEKLIVIVGPCSIHDPEAVLDYAKKLASISLKLKDKIFIIIRAYMEKPRTTIGWKGYFNDPSLDNKCDITYGIKKGRKLLVSLSKMNLPIAIEALDTSLIQYIADTVSWVCIGARTVESQVHREMVSGLSATVGFKNSTDGNITVALDAMESAKSPHVFLSINKEGKISRVSTLGNPFSHLILRGGRSGTNYSPEDISKATKSLTERNLTPNLIIDCSHGNSQKQFERQIEVCQNVISQRISGNKNIIGVMLESFINQGRQDIPKDLSKLQYGISVTDACLSWDQTEKLLLWIHEKIK